MLQTPMHPRLGAPTRIGPQGNGALECLRLPRRLWAKPHVALESKPFSPSVASHRRATVRERPRFEPIETGHSVSGIAHAARPMSKDRRIAASLRI